MKTLTIRDFRSHPRAARAMLARDGEAILTASGRPVAVLLSVEGDALDETLLLVHRVRAQRAAAALRDAASASGVRRAGSGAVAREIRAVRAARRRSIRRAS